MSRFQDEVDYIQDLEEACEEAGGLVEFENASWRLLKANTQLLILLCHTLENYDIFADKEDADT